MKTPSGDRLDCEGKNCKEPPDPFQPPALTNPKIIFGRDHWLSCYQEIQYEKHLCRIGFSRDLPVGQFPPHVHGHEPVSLGDHCVRA